MQYNELNTRIAAILAPGFQLQYGAGYRNTFSLKIDGEYFCFEEYPDVILWAIKNPEEWQAKQDAEIADLLADLSKGAKPQSNEKCLREVT